MAHDFRPQVVANLLRYGWHRPRKAHAMQKTPSSFRTHIMVQCNTHETNRCRFHKDGTRHDHRVLREALPSLREVLGK